MLVEQDADAGVESWLLKGEASHARSLAAFAP
jgi:hypothetical protein